VLKVGSALQHFDENKNVIQVESRAEGFLPVLYAAQRSSVTRHIEPGRQTRRDSLRSVIGSE